MRVGISLLSALTIFLCSFIGYSDFPAPVIRTGLINAGVKQIDSCLLVYGVNATTNSLVVELYDPQLRLLHQSNEKINGLIPDFPELTYSSDLRLEFAVYDKSESNHRSVHLDSELKMLYKSQMSTPATLISAQTKILDYYRIDDYAWEIRTETQQIGWSGNATVTRLFQYGIKLTPSFPVKELNRTIVLDSSAVEYAKVFLVRDNKIYVYVNESTAEGKQFVYCFNGLDGSLIYKTELIVRYDEARKNIDQVPASFSQVDACIFSNYYWDQKLERLILGGTWLADSANYSGIFLMQLDESGVIKSSIASEGIWLNSAVVFDPSKGIVSHRVHSKTYKRITKMGYQPGGDFVVVSEMYGLRLSSTRGDAETLRQSDDDYYYFCIQAEYFTMNLNSVKLKNENTVFGVTPWSANYHLDSIAGFIPKVTKLNDEKYPNNVNVLCDGDHPVYYCAGLPDDGKGGIKVLSKNTVNIDGARTAAAYFEKTVASRKGANCVPILSPSPVHEQSFSEKNDYYAIDAQRLYRVTQKDDGIVLKIMGW